MTESTMPQRSISIEAVAAREMTLRKRAEQDALILQDELFTAQKQIEKLTAELEMERANHVNAS